MHICIDWFTFDFVYSLREQGLAPCSLALNFEL